jgi:hypothetical protein
MEFYGLSFPRKAKVPTIGASGCPFFSTEAPGLVRSSPAGPAGIVNCPGDSLRKLFTGPTRLSPGLTIPLKAISIAIPGGGLIFEGLRELWLRRNGTFCQDFREANPQRSARCNIRWNSFEISPFGEQPSRLRQGYENSWRGPDEGLPPPPKGDGIFDRHFRRDSMTPS